MKKLCLLICIGLLAVLALVACEKTPEPHTHTYADDWSYDQEGHWYAATCEHTGEKANAGAHVDEQNDGVCDICGYGSDHTHTFDPAWSYDEQGHWHSTTCGHNASSEQGAHADADNDDLCDICGYSGGCAHPADESKWLSDDSAHWRGASCGHNVKLQADAHVDADNNGSCDVCAWSDPSHTHTFKTDYTYDRYNHWFDADCGHALRSDIAEHVDLENDGICDVCGWNEGCTHPYSQQWSKNATLHWRDVICDHSIAPTDMAEHVDENNDGICDVCEYLDHEHIFNTDTWEFDQTDHWHAADCGCAIKQDQAAHVDADNNGECDVCDWDSGCEHPLKEHWSHDAYNHWRESICSHAVGPFDKAAHADFDKDGICDVCSYTDSAHTHTFQSALTVGVNTHYYAATCGHSGVRKDEQAHVDDNGDDRCDVCGGIASLEILIDKATSQQSAAQVGSGTITNTSTYYFSAEPTVNVEQIFYEFGDGYLFTDDGLYKRWLTLMEDGTVFGVRMIESSYEPEDAWTDSLLGYHFNGHFLYYNFEAYGVESMLYNMYTFAEENALNGIDGVYDAQNDQYKLSFTYDNQYGSLYMITVDLSLSEQYVIESMHIRSVVYSISEGSADGNGYPAQGATPDYIYEVEIAQQLGPRDAVNDHGPEKFLFSSYDFVDASGNLLGDTLYLEPGETVKLYFANVVPESASAKLDHPTISVNATSSQLYQYLSWTGDCITVKGIAAGTYTMSVQSAKMTKQITVVVGTPVLQSLMPQIYYKDYSGLYTSTVSQTYSVYVGQSLYFGAAANPSVANAGFTAAVSGGTLGDATILYGSANTPVKSFRATEPGTYTITLTSTENASITTTLTVQVEPEPSVADILNGSYMADIYDYNVSDFYSVDILVTFVPDAQDAARGQVTITRNGSETEVLSYVYQNGEITLTHLSGEVLGYTLSLNDMYSVTLGWNYGQTDREQVMQAYTYTNRVNAEVWISADEMVGNDTYRYQFIFGDQGYVFDGENYTYPDILSSVNDQTGAITVTFLNSVAGTELASIQSITFDPEQNIIRVVFADRTVVLTPDRGR